MKKTTLILSLSLFALIPSFSFAEEGTSTIVSTIKEVAIATTTATSTPEEVKPFTVCSQEAIEKRDTDIAASRNTYNAAMTNALTVRKNKEKLAVAIKNASDKKDALKLSVETYKNQTKVAQNTLTQARKEVWQTFEDDIALCRKLEDEAIKAKEDAVTSTSTEQGEAFLEKSIKSEESEVKTFKEVIKEQFETLKSLFN